MHTLSLVIALAALVAAATPAPSGAALRDPLAADAGPSDAGASPADESAKDPDADLIEHLDVLEKLDLLENFELFDDADRK